MKKANSFLFILLTITLSVLQSCKESSIIDPIPDIMGDCSAISDTMSDYVATKLLGSLHPVKYPRSASLKGTYLLYSDFMSEAVYLMNTKTGEKKMLNFQSMLPSNMKFVFFNNAVTCPYDDNLFLVHLTVNTDTVGNNLNYHKGYHIFVFDVIKNALLVVTPPITGKYGTVFGLRTWLQSSTPESNNFFLAPYGIVNFESNSVINPFYKSNIFAVSSTGKDFVYFERSYDSEGIELNKYYLNDIALDFDPNFWTNIPEGLHFSQEGKYLLFTTLVEQMKPKVFDPFDPDPQPQKDTIAYSQKRFLETFIVDVDKTLSAGKMVLHKIIRYRRDLCLTGVYFNAKFLTPRSYVISYRYNNSELHQLHEISIDGKILGQITR